ncbi:MAG: rod shape-determining protein MreC [Paludibacteraceae bacterium]|nr:rod shape-determining protein MreC [Paludibacteraceae bacterium]
MQNLWKILLRYSNFLVFILLEVAAFLLLFYNQAYPRSSVLSTANEVIAWQYEQEEVIRDYFRLKRINSQLAEENAMLRNQLALLQGDSAISYHSVRVVQLTTDRLHNYLTIDRGENDGIRRGQGVRNQDGVVGIVRTVGLNYSVVLPIINMQTNLSCRFKKNDFVGFLQWDGSDIRYAQLADIPSHLVVNIGDTIVTSGLSPVFPEGLPVGVVESRVLHEGDSYYTIRVRLQANFKRLKYVEVIKNANQDELEELEETEYGLD